MSKSTNLLFSNNHTSFFVFAIYEFLINHFFLYTIFNQEANNGKGNFATGFLLGNVY